MTTGYQGNNEGGFLFIADGDNAKAMAWKFDLSGNLLTTTALGVDGMQQGAKVEFSNSRIIQDFKLCLQIRADPVNGGYVIAGSVWMDDQQVRISTTSSTSNMSLDLMYVQGIVVKMNNDLSVAWSQDYGLNTGADQIFDLVVDR